MIKENSLPIPDIQSDIIERLSPLEKVISTENLSYIPNLYFRKYKLIESLNHERYDFPEQKILVPRPKTSWDAVLCEMREKAQLRKEIKKYKIAQNYHVSKTAKQQFIKKQLKDQERMLYHRIIANQLSENVQQFFKNSPNKNQLSNGQTNNQRSKQIENKKNEVSKGPGLDDIFIDKQGEDYYDENNAGDIDFFDDILNDGAPPKQINILADNNELIQPAYPRRSIKDYVVELAKFNQEQSKNKMDEEGYQQEPVHISRKSCLKKINQNLRRRLKNKLAESQDRSLTSATVALSNLINNYPQYKESDNFIELPSEIEWIFDDGSRNKRKKQQDFQLNWDDQYIDNFRQMNPSLEFDKVHEMQTVLQLTLDKSEYTKVFQRNIATNYRFPANIQSIKSFSSKFDKKKFYFNEFHDQDYQKFVMRNNKRKLLQKFQKNSNYMFAEHYVQDEIQNNEKVSMGKMFLYPPNKISDRLIYKVVPGTTKISVIAKDYNKKNFPLSRQKIILLSYLVNKYLTQFGNNWKTITQFIQIFPCFSNYLIKPELVQELYQMINRHELKVNYLDNLQIWDKKLLPSSQIYNGSYKDYQQFLKQSNHASTYKQDQMTEESSNQEIQQNSNFQLDTFEKCLQQPLSSKTSKKQIFGNLSKKYKQYGAKLCARTTNDIYNFQENKVNKSRKVIQQYRNTYGITKVQLTQKIQNQDKITQYVLDNMKGQIKNGLPFRKKKNINQRNNQLVKILQALRSKNTANMPPPGAQKGPQQMNKPMNGPQKIVTTQQLTPINQVPTTQSLPNKPVQPTSQKQPKKTKTPQKPRIGNQMKKNPKKKQGQEQKQKK